MIKSTETCGESPKNLIRVEEPKNLKQGEGI